ncbi:ubiquitin carboxyl-terminal hydrolase 17-like protein 6, partial [Odocoileus virginianus]|uniref:Ubiquitin carboxyl-terminal hydrolase n=1 Tax=Odocoileus virginianus TaxID=9874 RepID=A0ABM4HYZ9_ODOVR
GWPQRGDLAPGSAGLAPGHQVALSWRGPWGVGAGLQNLGNTCYVNAVLQCLSHTPPLARWNVSLQHATLYPARTSCTLCAGRAHVTRALLLPGEVIRPRKDLLAGFHRHQQEDAHEFLMFTLNPMQQGCLSASQPSGHPSEDTTLIRQIFGGTWRSQIQCVHCLGVSDTFDPYLDISLDITAAQSVEQALRELVKPEKLDVENAYDCGVCLRKVPATKRLTLHRTSQVLVLVLKWFTQMSGAKSAQEVHYPQCLDLQPFTSERKAGPLGYVLYAMLVHSGWSGERGHYFSYVRAGSGQWYKMDDAKVTACEESAALSQSAYVLSLLPGGCVVSPGDTEVEGISLEPWRRLKEHNRPKTASDLWKIQSALPAGPVVTHQSKHGAGRNGKLPEEEHERVDRSRTDSPPPGPMSIGNGPCASGRARATKRKNKKPRPSLGLWQ